MIKSNLVKILFVDLFSLRYFPSKIMQKKIILDMGVTSDYTTFREIMIEKFKLDFY